MNKILTALTFFATAIGIVYAQNEPYAFGADISWMQEKEKTVKYYRNGQAKDLLAILKESGFNYIRLRLFVDPTAKITGESESPYSTKGYCGLDSTIKVAQRVKAAGMKFLLDFHYSDTWADPGKQYKPVSWSSLNTVPLLAEKVRSYTKETLLAFKNAGTLPDMVQVGNEVVGGMIWPEGRNYASGGKGSWADFATLVNAGIDGVKDVDANIKIMMHTISKNNPNGWLTSLKNAGTTRIDVIGLSYYTQWHGDTDSLQRTVSLIASKHNIKIAVAEYSGNHRKVNDIIFNLPDKKGFGTFVWEPTDWNDDGYGATLFDWKNNPAGRHSNELLELYPQMVIDYGITSIQPSSSSRANSSSSSAQSSSSAGTTPVLNVPSAEKNIESIRVYFDGSSVLIKKTLSNGKEKVFDLKGNER